MTALAIGALVTPQLIAARQAGKLPTGPDAGDEDLSPFYRWTGTLPTRPGEMLRQEPARDDPRITAASLSRRILYTSTDGRWGSGIVPVSGTFYLPAGAAPVGGWPVIAWAHGTLGVADRCAPSWAGHKPRDGTYINRWLEAGYAVVATDYQGLGGPGPHAYLVWQSEGRSILDAVRAVMHDQRGKLAPSVFVTGQSQGSASALGTARLQPGYAPDVPLRGVIATGVAAHVPTSPYVSAEQPGGTNAHYTVLRLVGGSLPDGVAPESVLSAKGRSLLAAARHGCTTELHAVADREGITTANAFDPDEKTVMARLRHVQDMPGDAMPVPLLLGTGLADSLIPPRYQYSAVRGFCAGGSDVTWKTYPGATHNGGLNAAFPDALAFAGAIRAGRRPAGNCATVAEPGLPGPATKGVPFND